MRKSASSEMTSDSVELCGTEACFLHIQLMETNVWLPKTHNILTRGRFWIFQISCKVGVLKQCQSALLCSMSHMTRLFIITRVVDIRYQTSQSFVKSSCPFDPEFVRTKRLWLLEQVCVRTREWQVYQCVPNIYIVRRFVSTLLTILQRFPILLPSRHGVWDFVHIAELFNLSVRNTFPHISSHVLPCHEKKWRYAAEVSINLAMSQLSQQKFVIRTCSWNFPQYHSLSCIHVECNPSRRDQGMMSVLLNRHFSSIFSTFDRCSSHFYLVHVHRQ